MKAYGLPRNQDVEWPDPLDQKHFGLKTSSTGIEVKNKTKKRATRRIYKRLARQDAKKQCQQTD